MQAARPVLISVVQYQDELAAGTLAVLDVLKAAQRLGADGVELRAEHWRDKERELGAARALAEDLGLLITYATTTTLFSADAAGEQSLRRDIDDARALGAPQLRVFQGPAPADDDPQGWAAGEEAVTHAAPAGPRLSQIVVTPSARTSCSVRPAAASSASLPITTGAQGSASRTTAG